MADETPDWRSLVQQPLQALPQAAPATTTAAPNWRELTNPIPQVDLLNNQQPEKPKISVPLGAGATIQSLMRGATGGISDKAIDASKALYDTVVDKKPFAPSYFEERQADQARQAHYADVSPGQQGVDEVIGGLVGLPLAAAVRTGKLIGDGLEIGSNLSKGAQVGRAAATGAKVGAGYGAASGFANAPDESVSGDILEATKGATVGGITGTVLGGGAALAADSVVRPIATWASSKLGGNPYDLEAIKHIGNRLAQDAAAGGPTAQDILDILSRTPDKPQVIADVAGENVRARAGSAIRQPGPGRQQGKAFLEERDKGANTRLNMDVDAHISDESAPNVVDALKESRKNASTPLYEKAFAGGSMAPLQTQLQNQFADASMRLSKAADELQAADNEITVARAKQSNTNTIFNDVAQGKNPHVREEADAAARYEKAKAQVDQIANEKDQILDRLRVAQGDAASQKPGAVWSPTIQKLIDDPIAKDGIKQGLEIQRLEALGHKNPETGRPEPLPFDPTEYAITGKDANGDPIVNKVPNMRLLDAYKQGLDHLLGQYRDKDTGILHLDTRGKAIESVRKSLVAELDSLNPDYAPARKAYSGPSASIDAVKLGERVFNRDPSDSAKALQSLEDGDKEFYRIGMARATKNKFLENRGNEANTIYTPKKMETKEQAQLKTGFANQTAYEKFMDAVAAEHRMYGTNSELLQNSLTAPRVAEDAHNAMEAHKGWLGPLAQTITGVAAGEPWIMAQGAARLGQNASSHVQENPALNAAITRRLFDPNRAHIEETLRQALRAGRGTPPSINGNVGVPLSSLTGRIFPQISTPNTQP